jgi:hypothetical protein
MSMQNTQRLRGASLPRAMSLVAAVSGQAREETWRCVTRRRCSGGKVLRRHHQQRKLGYTSQKIIDDKRLRGKTK